MKVTNRRLQKIQTAIVAIGKLQTGHVLAGYTANVPQWKTDPTSKIAINAKFSYALRRNHDKIESALAPYYKTREDRLKFHSKDGTTDLEVDVIKAEGQPDQPNQARIDVLKEIQELLDEVVDVEFHMISENEFILDKNNIPIQHLNDIREFTIDPFESAKPVELAVAQK